MGSVPNPSVMLTEILKAYSLDALLKLLVSKQGHLAISKTNKAGALLIAFNKKQVEFVELAIIEKRHSLQ